MASTSTSQVGSSWSRGIRSYLSKPKGVHAAGMEMAKFNLGLQKGAGFAGRVLGLGMTAYAAYEGYKEGGVFGAVKGGVESVGESYLVGAGLKMLSGPLKVGAVAVGTAANIAGAAALGEIAPGSQGFAAMVGGPVGFVANTMSSRIFPTLARSAVASHMRSTSELEMGRPVIDEFGTLATMRQRSMMAIQNSKINGRSGIGNEATYMFRPYFR